MKSSFFFHRFPSFETPMDRLRSVVPQRWTAQRGGGSVFVSRWADFCSSGHPDLAGRWRDSFFPGCRFSGSSWVLSEFWWWHLQPHTIPADRRILQWIRGDAFLYSQCIFRSSPFDTRSALYLVDRQSSPLVTVTGVTTVFPGRVILLPWGLVRFSRH